MIDTFAMRELLRGEYKETFEKISLYGDMSNINSAMLEDRITNIYDLLMEAQNEEKPVDKIVGTNLEKFCRSYFKYDSVGDILKEICKRILNVAVILFVFSFLDYFLLSEEKVPFTKARVNIVGLFIGLLVALAIIGYSNYVKRKKIFIEGNVKYGWHLGVIAILFFVGIIGLPILISDVVDFSPSLLMTVLVIGAYAGGYFLVTMIYRIVKYGSLKNPNKLTKEEKAERNAANKEIEEKSENITTARDLSERFLKLKAKNEKKGKPEYTMEEFTKLIKNDISQEKGIKIFMVALAVGATVFNVYKTYGSDGLKGAILMFVILGVILTLVCRFMCKILTEVNISMKQVIETCEERDINIVDYYKELSQ